MFHHQNPRLGIYGMVIPTNADRLTVTLLDVSNESLALIKIVGKVQKKITWSLHRLIFKDFSTTSRKKKKNTLTSSNIS